MGSSALPDYRFLERLTSHTYKEPLAREIFSRIPRYEQELRRLYVLLTARFSSPPEQDRGGDHASLSVTTK